MKLALALLFLTVVTPEDLATPADRLALKRGMNTEIWLDWLPLDEMLTTPGFLDTYPDYPRQMPPGQLTQLASEGFDFLRIAADPAPLLALAGTDRETALLAQLRARVDEAQAAGLKVILDLHAFPRDEDYDVEWALASDANFAAYTAMAARVAATLNGLPPDRTALQLMNEPTQDCDALTDDPATSTWPPRLKRLHDAARQAAPDLPLVLSGACWGGAWALAQLDPALIGDANVLWSIHSYDPFLFTHQGATWTDEPARFFSGIPYPPDKLDDPTADRLFDDALARAEAAGDASATSADLDTALLDYREGGDEVAQPLEQAALWADAHGIPRNRLILDEFGAMRETADGTELDRDSYLAFIADKRRAAEDRGIGWAVWSWRGTMRVSVSDDSYTLDPQVCTALGLPGC